MTLCFRSAKIINHTFWRFVFKIKFPSPFLPNFWLVVDTSHSPYLLFICSCPSSLSSGFSSLFVSLRGGPSTRSFYNSKVHKFSQPNTLAVHTNFRRCRRRPPRHCRFFAHLLCSLSNIICMDKYEYMYILCIVVHLCYFDVNSRWESRISHLKIIF